MRTQGSLWLLIASLLCLTPIAFSQTPVQLSDNGSYSAVSCDGPQGCVGAGLYGGTINGVNVGSGDKVAGMICDDYFDTITPGEKWNANGFSVANLTSGNIGSLTLFGTGMGSAAIQDYTEIAYLVGQMFNPSLSHSQQAALSEAIWYITSGTASDPGLLNSHDAGYDSTAQAYLTAAGASGVNLSQFAGLYVYTPTSGPPRPQEMWSMVAVPEGGTALAYLLLAGLACFGAMVLRSRRQLCARGSA